MRVADYEDLRVYKLEYFVDRDTIERGQAPRSDAPDSSHDRR